MFVFYFLMLVQASKICTMQHKTCLAIHSVSVLFFVANLSGGSPRLCRANTLHESHGRFYASTGNKHA